jgi:hypothetical protein
MFKWIGRANTSHHLDEAWRVVEVDDVSALKELQARVGASRGHLLEVRLRRDLTFQSAQWSLLRRLWATSAIK